MSGMSGKSGLRKAALLLAAALCFTGMVLAQLRIDTYRDTQTDEQLLYLPNEKLLGHFTGGLNSVIANLLWVQCIQYTVSEAQGDRGFIWLNHMLETVVRLDPYFVDAYRYGGMFLAALKADDDAGLRLLQQGIRMNPRAWELPYEAGMIYLLNRKDWPGSRRMAAYYMGISAATGNAPPRIIQLAARLQGDYDITDVEREMWLDISQSDDRFMREIAERKLIELELRDAVTILSEVVRDYIRREGSNPSDFEVLVQQGYLQGLPQDPLGGTFIIAEDGQVLSSTLLDESLTNRTNHLNNALQQFHEQYESWPESLYDLVEVGLLPMIPAHPFPGRDWHYDPATGTLQG